MILGDREARLVVQLAGPEDASARPRPAPHASPAGRRHAPTGELGGCRAGWQVACQVVWLVAWVVLSCHLPCVAGWAGAPAPSWWCGFAAVLPSRRLRRLVPDHPPSTSKRVGGQEPGSTATGLRSGSGGTSQLSERSHACIKESKQGGEKERKREREKEKEKEKTKRDKQKSGKKKDKKRQKHKRARKKTRRKSERPERKYRNQRHISKKYKFTCHRSARYRKGGREIERDRRKWRGGSWSA